MCNCGKKKTDIKFQLTINGNKSEYPTRLEAEAANARLGGGGKIIQKR